MAVQLPPNSTGVVVATLTSGGLEFQKNILSDGVAPTVLASVVTKLQGVVTEVGQLSTRAHPADGTKLTYGVGAIMVPVTGANTTLVEIAGSASKTVKVNRITFAATKATTAETWNVKINKTSAAATGGTAVVPAVVPYDSADAAGTAVVSHFTAAPTVGTAIADIMQFKYTALIAPAQTVLVVIEFGKMGKCPTLRGIAETLAIDITGTTTGHASSVTYSIEWTEE